MGTPEANPPPQGSHLFGTFPPPEAPRTSTRLTSLSLTDSGADWRPLGQLIGAEVDPDKNDTDTTKIAIVGNLETMVLTFGDLLDHGETGDQYLIYTDDVYPGDIDGPDTGLLAGAFKPACITIKGDTGRNTSNVPFIRDGVDTTSRGVVQEFDKYWCVYLCAAYEYALNSDNDPNGESEGGVPGCCLDDPEPEYSYVFKETIRDRCVQAEPDWNAAECERKVVCHEIGHQFELDDDTDTESTCLMRSKYDPEKVSAQFCPACIARIRRVDTVHEGIKHP